ncbi:hypothetical protein FOC84_19680 [Achromobacter pestifer]|uniref:Formylmethanofuran dehydrogenase subunit E domain-containing protein n=1 Tax=Achromobacter pestifer TaxID=1353889 RepID=A0A7D4HSW2_9BURK|nr:hypothetical protein [Achromobacter pestifer]QKH37039.1 hypothetical protein FOC84_19680 [Achromobacter pestifer]
MTTPEQRASSLTVMAEEGPLPICFDAVQAYHGHGALAMLALTFQGLRGALPTLEQDGVPVPRKELSVISGHPGPGVRDAFEFVTRAVTRGCYSVDLTLPEARYSRGADKSYSFHLRRGARSVQGVLRPGVLPPEFFDLLGNPAPDAQRVHAELRRDIAARVIAAEPATLFDFFVTESQD